MTNGQLLSVWFSLPNDVSELIVPINIIRFLIEKLIRELQIFVNGKGETKNFWIMTMAWKHTKIEADEEFPPTNRGHTDFNQLILVSGADTDTW